MCSKDIEKQADFYGAKIVDFNFSSSIRGAYYSGVIGINKNITNCAERRCIIACELGRHILRKNSSIFLTEDQENILAMHWAVSTLIPFSAFINAKRHGYCAKEFADYLKVTEGFLLKGIELYKTIYGTKVMYQDYVIDLENKKIESLKKVG